MRRAIVVGLITLLGLGVRLAAGSRQGLDGDEVFSLAMATGHSIEQPSDRTRAVLGDFVQARAPQTAASYRRYAEHDSPPAGISRVIRAVFLSDTNPPLYYVLLNFWTRIGGTGDFSLRLLSILASTACIPLCFMVGRRLFGSTTGVIAAVLFALAPQSVFYGSLGRMYPILLMLVLLTALCTIRLHRKPDNVTSGAWVLVSTAGLLTHYFFVFAWLALCVWLLVWPQRMARMRLFALAAITLVAIAPWYVRIPESMEGWRVTKGWLETMPAGFDPVVAQIRLIAGYFLVGGSWMDRKGIGDYVLIACILVAVIAVLMTHRRIARLKATHMLLLMIVASSAGLLVFDLIQHTFARQHPRYAVSALPAALILFAAVLARLPLRLRLPLLAVVITVWAEGLLRLNSEPTGDNPLRTVARLIDEEGSEDRVVIVHGIPSRVIGYARYVTPNTMMQDWVEQSGGRTVERDAEPLVETFSRITLIKSPPGKAPVPEETWFRSMARETSVQTGRGYEKLDFLLSPDAAERSIRSR